MSSAGVCPLCFLNSTVNAVIYQEIYLHCFLLLTSFWEMLISFSSRTPRLPTLPEAGSMTHGVTVLGQLTPLTWAEAHSAVVLNASTAVDRNSSLGRSHVRLAPIPPAPCDHFEWVILKVAASQKVWALLP